MRRQVRDLLMTAAEAPTRPVDPVALRRRVHRRSRAAGAGVAGLGLVLVAVVAVAMVGGDPAPQLALDDTPPASPPPPTAVADVADGADERIPPVPGPSVPEVADRDTPPPSPPPPAPAAGADSSPAPSAPATGSRPAPTVAGEKVPSAGAPDHSSPPELSSPPVPPPPEPDTEEAPAFPAPEPVSRPSPSRRTVALPTHDEAEVVGAVHGATVVGDGDRDGGCVWLVAEGRPRAVRWEAGTTARFTAASDGTETVEVLDGAGSVIARGGEHVTVVAAERPGRLDRCHVGEEAVVWHISLA